MSASFSPSFGKVNARRQKTTGSLGGITPLGSAGMQPAGGSYVDRDPKLVAAMKSLRTINPLFTTAAARPNGWDGENA
ncbi:hypothetical protein [Mesorhizobium sp. M1B.F.Ca.ET.045.04.1.1]|uniref:hypothetical protein n=1 Tax=Mesorhizobium sp. M1B.F.Ca.ET.045.04.1.1 TaxID=2493673 RepID=UPI000F751D41|nr:hypothetical protein [Mesorhizobium sp. M1B.F.Ca.ET.045.04.1.1]AZO28711.1 hypothetical protein EJ071_15910 [Mesorhizobium sp. M1B.F.Ca.ET.045.04.1.1]